MMNSRSLDDPFEREILDAVNTGLSHAVNDQQTVIQVLNFYRRECESEMNLISVRVGWLLTAQAFLIAGSIVALSGAATKTNQIGILLPFVSMANSALGMFISVRSKSLLEVAERTTYFWKERMRSLYKHAEHENPWWISLFLGRWLQGGKDMEHDDSMKFSRHLPNAFLIFWVILAVISLVASLQSFML